jgi:D-threo-aldose 1-dehydrogenase
MKRNPIGRTAVRVTELGFGGAPLGNLYTAIDDEVGYAAVHAAWEGGVRYFDTAPHYGLGLSERRLGAVLRDKPRADYVISTKVGRLLVENPGPTGSDLESGGFAVPDDLMRHYDYSRDAVRRSLEGSLERLGLDHVDIVYLHDPDDHLDQAVREGVPALAELREHGVIGAVGAGMNFVAPLLRFVTETDVDAVMLAGRWTLADRTGAPLLEACEERGVSVVAAAPYNSGLLAHAYPDDDSHFNYDRAPASVLAFARALAERCAADGVSLPRAALQFPLHHPAVPTVVVGMRTDAQARGNLGWAAEPLAATTWAALAELDASRPASLRSA